MEERYSPAHWCQDKLRQPFQRAQDPPRPPIPLPETGLRGAPTHAHKGTHREIFVETFPEQ